MIHDTHMSQHIPPTLFHFSTATITWTTGAVAGTAVATRANVNQTSLITIPILIPSNDSALKGSYLKSIEINYQVLGNEPTSITFTVNKVTRGADGAVAVVAAQAHTATLTAATCKTVDKHKNVLTITTPFWIDQNEYVLVELSLVAGAAANTEEFLGAVANYTARM